MNQQLQQGLSELKLKYWGQALTEDLVKMKDQEREVISKYLGQWIAREKSERYTSMIQSKIRTAKFRRVETIQNYDFRHSKMTEKIEKNYLALHNGIAKIICRRLFLQEMPAQGKLIYQGPLDMQPARRGCQFYL